MLPTPDLVLQLQVLGQDGAEAPADDIDSADDADAPAAPRQATLRSGTPLGQSLLEALSA